MKNVFQITRETNIGHNRHDSWCKIHAYIHTYISYIIKNRENSKADISNLNSGMWATWTIRPIKFYNLIFKF